MTIPLIKVGALPLAGEFETALTKRRGCVIERVHRSEGVMVEMTDGVTLILHKDVKVRPLVVIH